MMISQRQDMTCAVCSYSASETAAKFNPPAPEASFQPTVEDWLTACGWKLGEHPLCCDCHSSNDEAVIQRAVDLGAWGEDSYEGRHEA